MQCERLPLRLRLRLLEVRLSDELDEAASLDGHFATGLSETHYLGAISPSSERQIESFAAPSALYVDMDCT